MSIRPLYIVIDVDGTLIGDVTPQVCEWELIKTYDSKRIKQFKTSFCEILRNGLLRPGFTTFVDHLRMNHADSQLFIYTSSERQWANFIVPCIEYVTGVTFVKPIFTRSHCIKVGNEYKKSLDKIAPIIYEKSNSKKSLADMLSSLILIDNTNVILKQEEKSIVLCPTYKYVHLRDVTRLLDADILNKQYQSMMTVMESYNMFPKGIEKQLTVQQFMSLHYRHLYHLISHLHKQERDTENDSDNFWPVLGQIMSKQDFAKSSKESIVRSINEKLVSRYKGLLG